MSELACEEIKSILEALLVVSKNPISINDLKTAFDEDQIDSVKIKTMLNELSNEYDEKRRGFQVVEIAQKYQICTRSDFAPWVKRFLEDKTEERMSQPALETLAIVSYRQPITKMEIESVRGVNVDGMLRSLIDKGLVKVGGKKDVLGKPFVYVTTEKFLEYFGLKNIKDLPRKDELNYEKKKSEEKNETESEDVKKED